MKTLSLNLLGFLGLGFLSIWFTMNGHPYVGLGEAFLSGMNATCIIAWWMA